MKSHSLNRRILLLGALAAGSLPAQAQQPAKVLRVGVVSGQPRPSILWQSFLARMTALGYQEGRNFTFDLVLANTLEEYQAGYRRFSGGTVDVIVAPGPEISLKSAMAIPGTTPIVMVAIDYDPVVHGYVKSLARPGGHVTGLMLQQIELAGKRVELLKDTFPNLKAMTVFWDQSSADQWAATQDAAANSSGW